MDANWLKVEDVQNCLPWTVTNPLSLPLYEPHYFTENRSELFYSGMIILDVRLKETFVTCVREVVYAQLVLSTLESTEIDV